MPLSARADPMTVTSAVIAKITAFILPPLSDAPPSAYRAKSCSGSSSRSRIVSLIRPSCVSGSQYRTSKPQPSGGQSMDSSRRRRRMRRVIGRLLSLPFRAWGVVPCMGGAPHDVRAHKAEGGPLTLFRALCARGGIRGCTEERCAARCAEIFGMRGRMRGTSAEPDARNENPMRGTNRGMRGRMRGTVSQQRPSHVEALVLLAADHALRAHAGVDALLLEQVVHGLAKQLPALLLVRMERNGLLKPQEFLRRVVVGLLLPRDGPVVSVVAGEERHEDGAGLLVQVRAVDRREPRQ